MIQIWYKYPEILCKRIKKGRLLNGLSIINARLEDYFFTVSFTKSLSFV